MAKIKWNGTPEDDQLIDDLVLATLAKRKPHAVAIVAIVRAAGLTSFRHPHIRRSLERLAASGKVSEVNVDGDSFFGAAPAEGEEAPYVMRGFRLPDEIEALYTAITGVTPTAMMRRTSPVRCYQAHDE